MRFSEILFIVTTVTGLIWMYDLLWGRYRDRLSFSFIRYAKRRVDPWWIEYSKAFFPVFLLVFLLRSFLLEPFRIPSGSMRPTLLEGDLIIVNKYNYGLRLPFFETKIINVGVPKRGDIIVFKHEKEGESIDMIKRVIGLPNDHIEYKGKVIYVNGEPIKQEFLREKTEFTDHGDALPVREFLETIGLERYHVYAQNDGFSFPSSYKYNDVIVPENSYFVIGDNRDNSRDSRFWGFVHDKDIQGRALAVWMSFDYKNIKDFRIRWEHLGSLYSPKE